MNRYKVQISCHYMSLLLHTCKCTISVSLHHKLGSWKLKAVSHEGLVKDIIKLHYGKCSSLYFGSLPF